MENLEHPLWIVQAVNVLLGPLVRAALAPLGIRFGPGPVIPDYIVMSMLIVVVVTVVCAIVRSRLSVEHPGKFQILLEDAVLAVSGMLNDWIGPKGEKYLPLVATLGIFILLGNYAGFVPGLMAPTSSINVTLGCALTIWVYYHAQGIREQGPIRYLIHFGAPPGSPMWLFPIMFFIEIVSHLSRILSLSLRLFGNIFGEELVILILASIVPFILPLPMMFG